MESPLGISDTLTKERKLGFFATLEALLERFSPSERLALYGCTIVLALSTLALLASVNAMVSLTVPSRGGTLTEGILGPARFINPVIAVSAADEDLTSLVYSGLTRSLPDGTIVPDLASSYEVSDDGLTYTFTIRPGATFHDGSPVTADDVVFTVRKVQDPAVKSRYRADWEGVEVASPDARTVVFTLPRAYSPFLQNTALGILPQHLWRDTKPEDFPYHALNTRPVGSGPFHVTDMVTDASGAATVYELRAFHEYALGTPYLRRITFHLYPNQDALVTAFNRGDIDAIAGIAGSQLETLTRTDTQVIRAPLPRVFGVFFNQGRSPVLADASVREALESAIDKDRLISLVLGGHGVPLQSPIPPGVLSGSAPHQAQPASTSTVSTAYSQETIDAARSALSRGGWSYSETDNSWKKGSQELSFTLVTSDAPELTATANAITTAWRQAGINVTMQVYPISELNTNVIRPREYDAVLFGEIVGRELDLFAFWHSSQRNDPGLNLALYTNARADTLLSQARTTTDKKTRETLYKEFESLIQEDRPAVFLYAPEFLYVVPEGLQGVSLGALTTPSERYLNAHAWYRETESVWNIFVR